MTGVRSVHLKSRYEKCAQLSAELHNARTCQRVAHRRGTTRRDATRYTVLRFFVFVISADVRRMLVGKSERAVPKISYKGEPCPPYFTRMCLL